MSTNLQIIERARRQHLNDADAVTWTNDELFEHLVHGLRLLQSKRPDLYYGVPVETVPDLEIDDTFPLDGFVEPAIQDYVVARAQFKDDEYAVQGAAAPFYALFKEGLA